MMEYNPERLRKFVAPEFVFGWGARALASQYVHNLGGTRVLLVTDRGVQAAGWTDELTDDLVLAGITPVLFSEVTPNPRDHEVAAGAARYRSERCDAIVAIGGGSPMDCAKGIGIVCANGGDIADFEGVDRIPNPCPPLIFIPTTAGTSADVSQFAIITNTTDHHKMAIISKAVVPDVSLIDPECTVTMSPELTAYTGMDAFSHAAESLASDASSPITDLHALDAIARIVKNLPVVMEAPGDARARSEMMLASLGAGLAFSSASLGAIHALAHSLGGLRDLTHGECNAILLPYVISYNFSHARSAYERMGEAMGLSLTGMDEAGRERAIVEAVVELCRRVGITRSFSDLGVVPGDIPTLAEQALRDACIVTNPRKPTQRQLEEICEQAL